MATDHGAVDHVLPFIGEPNSTSVSSSPSQCLVLPSGGTGHRPSSNFRNAHACPAEGSQLVEHGTFGSNSEGYLVPDGTLVLALKEAIH